MDITEITSIELDRTKPFEQVIRLKKGDWTAEVVPVNQKNAEKLLQIITERWWKAIQEKESK